jgi:hypothetical protein
VVEGEVGQFLDVGEDGVVGGVGEDDQFGVRQVRREAFTLFE